MDHIFIKILAETTHLSEEEKRALETYFPVEEVKKGTFLLKEGQVARSSYYIINGFVREYVIVDGEEKTTAFMSETEGIADFESLSSKKPSKKFIICEEDCKLVVLNSENEEKFYNKFPRFETFCRQGVEQMVGNKQQQITEFVALKAEDRYKKLQRENPGLINRAPQYQIASYLGIKPETLSRIRKKIVQSKA